MAGIPEGADVLLNRFDGVLGELDAESDIYIYI